MSECLKPISCIRSTGFGNGLQWSGQRCCGCARCARNHRLLRLGRLQGRTTADQGRLTRMRSDEVQRRRRDDANSPSRNRGAFLRSPLGNSARATLVHVRLPTALWLSILVTNELWCTYMYLAKRCSHSDRCVLVRVKHLERKRSFTITCSSPCRHAFSFDMGETPPIDQNIITLEQRVAVWSASRLR